MKIGIIGAGAIANFLLKETNQGSMSDLKVTSVYVRDKVKYEQLEKDYQVKLYSDLDAFLKSNIDIVVEAANITAVKELAPRILKEKDAVLISIGALADEAFLNEVYDLMEEYNRSIHLPSGAIGGLDLLQNAHALGGLTDVSLTTRKPANSLVNDPIEKEVIVFEGVAKDAIKEFPKNINVSIILSLAGIGMDKTKVKIIADPTVDNNIHTIDVSGEFGTATFSVTNQPLKTNPNTSYLAALSVLSTLKNRTNRMRIGL